MAHIIGKDVRGLAGVRGKIFAVAFAALVLVAAAPAFAVSAGEAAYAGGTSASIPNGTIGKLDMAGGERLVFRTASAAGVSAGEIDIPYSTITNFHYSTEVAHHIGVLPAIAVGMVKKRERKHFFTITYTDSSNGAQVAIFEVPKDEPPALLAILRARAAQACGKQAVNYCGGNLGGANGW